MPVLEGRDELQRLAGLGGAVAGDVGLLGVDPADLHKLARELRERHAEALQ